MICIYSEFCLLNPEFLQNVTINHQEKELKMTPEQIASLGKLGGAAMLGLAAMGSGLGAGAC